MFYHVFKYRLKINLFDKLTMFWTLLFPMLLATLFSLAFGQLGTLETFEPIDVAIVDTANDESFMAVAESVSTGENRLFNSRIVTKEQALSLLSEGKVQGIIETGEKPSLTVSHSGISQSILKSFMDHYIQSVSTISRIALNNPAAIENAVAMLSENMKFLEEIPAGRGNPDPTVIYFYSLLAMTCLFGGFIGGNEINAIQANLSSHAARISFAPIHKLKMILSGMCAALIVQFVKLFLALAYMAVVLSIDFGDRIGLIIVTLFVSALLGISFGAFITSLVKGEEGLKTGILIAVSNVSSFLAGMMYAEVKYIIETSAPIVSRINPASLITDAFYALYYFDTYNRYVESVVGILVLIAVFSAVTYFVIRRRKYVSI